MKKTKKKRDGHRLAARGLLWSLSGLAVVALTASAPGSGAAWGNATVLLAAGLRQPAQTAAVLEQKFREQPVSGEATTATAPSSTAPTSASVSTTVGTAVPAAATVSPPGEDGSGGKILTQTVPTGDTLAYGIAVRNKSGKTVDIPAALNTPLSMTFEETDQPQVLIVHTHTTENYMRYDAGYYNAADRKRSKDPTRTVCAVGDAMAKTLEEYGIKTIHDQTIHDSPKYSGAYTRSAETVQKNLDQYPGIRVVLDLHRDAIMSGDKNLVKPTATVDGKKAAQMMILVGTVSTQSLPNPNCQQNLALAAQWQRALTATEPKLMRPLTTVASRYNQHMHAGYLLIEVGAEGNTVEEAAYSGQLLGKTLAQLLKKEGGP